ncbi:MAG: hypothetical protein GYA15_08445 [Leptolinea sp.]|jgi:hypothetical protein|nr:hypothetical protein [Leptolinea sp.]
MALNPAQKTHLYVTLLEFEETLRLALDLLDNPESSGILYSKKLDVTPDDREEIVEIIHSALREIQHISKMYDLPAKDKKLNNLLVAKMSISWANLIDTQSSGLRKYGKLDNEIAENLDPIISSLSTLALRMSSKFSNSEEETVID